MSTVAFRHVGKRFEDGSQALTDIDLDVADGELLVLVGPSGCGKSTLLRLLAGLESVSEGELLIDGEVVNALPPQRRNVAMVFQNYALYPHMTVRGNLEFPLLMQKRPRAEIRERVSAVAAILDLTPLLERKPRQLSGGQRQRVAMGRAMVREPRVFLLDEPLSNLDARLRVRIRGEIAALQKRLGSTMLYVTHDQVEAMTLGDRVAVLNQGRLQQLATPRELYRRPANVFVAGFMGHPGMNIFPAELLDTGDTDLCLRWEGRTLPIPPERQAALRPYVGQPLQAGLRPEAFHPPAERLAWLVAEVANVESLGHEQLVYLQGEPPLVARLDAAHRARVGERIELGVDMGQLYLFGTDGVTLDWPGEA